MKTSPKRIVRRAAEHQVDDGLRDREVERAEVDRHPLVLLELLRRVELAARERVRRQRAARPCSAGPAAASSMPPSRLRARCSTRRAAGRAPPSSRPHTSTQPPARAICRTLRRRRRPPSRRSRERAFRKRPRLRRRGYPSVLCSRVSTSAERLRADPEHGADRPACRTGQPASRKIGSATAITIAPATAGRRVGGATRGCVQAGMAQTLRYLITVAATPTGIPTTAAEGEPVAEVSHRPADQRAHDDARRGESDEHAAGAGEGERRSLGLHRRQSIPAFVTPVFAQPERALSALVTKSGGHSPRRRPAAASRVGARARQLARARAGRRRRARTRSRAARPAMSIARFVRFQSPRVVRRREARRERGERERQRTTPRGRRRRAAARSRSA